MARDLAGGLVLRTATGADVEQIVALSVEAHGKVHEWGVRTLLDDPTVGPGRFTVVVDGDRVVSTLCLMGHTWRMGPVDVPVGRPEYVATAPAYQRRGLVRAQLDEVHRWSEERGDLVQMITGIGYVYRRFGYEYAVSFPAMWVLRPGVDLGPLAEWTVREPTLADIPTMRGLHHDDLARSDLWSPWTEREWRQLVERGTRWGATPLVAEREGRVEAVAVLVAEDPDEARVLHAVSAESLAAAKALVAHAREEAGHRGLQLGDRPGTLGAALLRSVAVPTPTRYAYYVRVPDPVALLDRLRPVLSARLAASPLGLESGELIVSLYQCTVALAYGGGEVTSVRQVETIENPYDRGVPGVPPDRFATFVFGKHHPRHLSVMCEDVFYGDQGGLVEVLFPRLVADVHPPL